MADRPITASMLYDYVRCPHRVALDLFGNPDERDKINPFIQLLWERGHAFERDVMAQLDVAFMDIQEAPDAERERFTLEAISASEPLIYGGRIAVDDLLGEPDLLRLQGSGYVAGDIKSGAGVEGESDDSDGKPKKHYAVQLGFYAEILSRKGLLGEGDPFVWDARGQEVPYDLTLPRGPKTPSTMWDEYRDALQAVQGIVYRTLMTAPAMGSECKLCHWRTLCSRVLVEADDLTLLPELGRARRDKLLDYVDSVGALANVDLSSLISGGKSAIPGVGADMLGRFQARARLQKQPKARPYLIGDVTLPPDDLELFFDVETDPMRDICYLHGFVERRRSDPTTERYIAFIAEQPTEEAERNAFQQAWDYVRENSPTGLYYYSHYEKTTWRKLANQYPEIATIQEVEDFFDADYAIDLYQDVVRSKMEWPTYDFSIKTIATFLGFKWRDPEPSGAASVQWYHKWVETGDDKIRQRILEYNEDDCVAMRVLVAAIRKLLASR